MAKKRSGSQTKTSAAWLREHHDDMYVKRAKAEGYRSRASYKLLEIQEKDRLIRPGMTVVDLGSAPGGWCQVAAPLVGEKGFVLASDILPMDAFADVHFVQGDFADDEVFDQLLAVLKDREVDLVMSDMAPNMSGQPAVDIPRAMHLVELSVDMADRVLKPGGNWLAKVFQGEGFEQLHRDLKQRYEKVITRKPAASRSRSREVYLLGKGKR